MCLDHLKSSTLHLGKKNSDQNLLKMLDPHLVPWSLALNGNEQLSHPLNEKGCFTWTVCPKQLGLSCDKIHPHIIRL